MEDVIRSSNLEKLIKRLGRTLESYAKSNKINTEITLHYAAWTRNEEKLRSICTENPSCINTKMHFDITALHMAAYQGFDKGVDLLLQSGANAKSRMQESGMQPIHIAASRGFECIIKSLLEAGASVEDTDATGMTALHWASGRGQTSCVRELLSKGSDVNDRGDANDTPLCLAFRYEHRICLKELLKAGADVACIYCMGGSSDKLLRWSVTHGHPHCVEAIVKRPDIAVNIHQQDHEGTTLLRCALQKNCIPTLHHLLFRERGIHYRDGLGNTLLHLAAKENIATIISSLVPIVCVNETNNEKCTALHVAARNGYENVVKELLKIPDILINPKNNLQETPLLQAARYGHLDVVKVLLKSSSIQTNEVDKDGRSALLLATKEGHREVVQVLLKAGVSINKTDKDGWTPFLWALKEGHLDIAKMLLEHPDILNKKEKDRSCKTPLRLLLRIDSTSCSSRRRRCQSG